MVSRDVEEPTHLSERVGDEIPSVVVWPCFFIHGLVLHIGLTSCTSIKMEEIPVCIICATKQFLRVWS